MTIPFISRKLLLLILLGCFATSTVLAQMPKLLYTFKHTSAIWKAKFSPDGKYIVTTSYDKTAKIWDVSTGKLLHTLARHRQSVGNVSFSPDGKYLVTASADETAKVWGVATGTLVTTLKGHKAEVSCAVFSPDGRYIVTSSEDHTARVWEALTGKQLLNLKGHSNHVYRCAFSPDGRYVVTGSTDLTAKVWHVATGQEVWSTPELDGSVAYVGFNPDGNEVLVIAGDHVSLWNAATGKFSKMAVENQDWNSTPLFSPDGRYRYSRTDDGKTVTVYDGVTNEGKWVLKGHTETIVEADFSPDATYIATASADDTAMLWQLPASTTAVTPPKPKAPASLEVRSITFSDRNGNNNNILDADESATIAFTVVNTGKGKAYNTVAEIKSLTSKLGLNYSAQTRIGNLNAGDSIVVRIPISATQSVESGKPEFEMLVKEGNGFNADPVRIAFNTQKFKSPQVTIADHKFTTDLGGKIKPNQPVALEIIVQNRGQGDASNVKVTFTTPANVFPGSEATFTIDKLKPNQSKNFRYEFFSNKMYTAKEIPIDVAVTESFNKYGERKTLNVSLDQSLMETQTLTIAGQADEVVKIDNVTLRPQVETRAQEPLTIEEPNATGGGPAFYSLFIGIETYQYASANLGNLDKPVKDATTLRNVLINNYTFPEKNSILLKNPNNAEIIKALEDLAEKVTPKDNLLIFYAGHGYWDPRVEIGYWLPSDSRTDDKSRWISNGLVQQYIKGIKSRHTLLISDACFSGSIFKTRDVTSEINEYAVAKIYQLPSRKAMTSGTMTIVPDDSKFMEFLVKRLNDNTSKHLTARELFNSLWTAVVNNTSTIPQFGVIQDAGDQGGDFIFIKK